MRFAKLEHQVSSKSGPGEVQMTKIHRRYLVVDQGIVAGVIDAVINAGFVFLFFRSMTVIPVSGQTSMTGDLIITSFLLPFFTVLIATPLIRAQVRNRAIPPMEPPRTEHPLLRRLPHGTFWRALIFGTLFLATLGPICVAGFAAFGVTGWSFQQFLVFKALFAAIFGAAVTPIIAFCALADSGDRPAGSGLPDAALNL